MFWADMSNQKILGSRSFGTIIASQWLYHSNYVVCNLDAFPMIWIKEIFS